MGGQNIFVFVVCGETQHTDTLNFSVRALKKFSREKIIVITDKTRNKAEIEHGNIIDVTTRKNFTNHQASIFLKTSLNKILEPGNQYCYLDSDVIALSSDVDKIFSYKSGPVTFASDHTTISCFSPYAVCCNCHDEYMKLQKLVEKHNPFALTSDINNLSARKLFCFLDTIAEKKNRRIQRFFLNRRDDIYKILRKRRINYGKGFYYNYKARTWEDKAHNVLLNDTINYKDKIEAESEFRFSASHLKWFDNDNNNISDIRCQHLVKCIHDKFHIEIPDTAWTHWNGGVFLFDDNSGNFMESWHDKTISIFSDPKWKVRDQGTLAATAWEFGLQYGPRIPEEFNFITDYFNPHISFDTIKGFTKDNFKTVIRPKFIHIYHNFGNENWDVWQGVMSIIKK